MRWLSRWADDSLRNRNADLVAALVHQRQRSKQWSAKALEYGREVTALRERVERAEALLQEARNAR